MRLSSRFSEVRIKCWEIYTVRIMDMKNNIFYVSALGVNTLSSLLTMVLYIRTIFTTPVQCDARFYSLERQIGPVTENYCLEILT